MFMFRGLLLYIVVASLESPDLLLPYSMMALHNTTILIITILNQRLQVQEHHCRPALRAPR